MTCSRVASSHRCCPSVPDVTLDATVVRFARELRAHGFPIGAREVIDATTALTYVDIGDQHDVRLTLRAALASSRDDVVRFDALFAQHWTDALVSRSGPLPTSSLLRRRPADARPAYVSLETWMKRPVESNAETIETKSFSAHDATGGKRASMENPHELAQVTRVAREMVRDLARRPGRRWQPSRRGARIDLRRMMRRSIGFSGELVEIATRRRRPKRRRIVALCDVSGSMELYSRFLLQFLFALQNAGTSVESFVFATRLSHVTPHLRDSRWSDALESLADDVRDWSAGTRIGEALERFTRGWSRRIDRHTVVVILSDGWDTGAPELVDAALSSIHERGARIVWLNPLLGSASYTPQTRTMIAALPYLDLFAPLHDVASLRALRRALVRLS
jgi:uncharacterized protein